ncbi:MAG: RNA polymerase factor sigma-54, partial [Nitrososphaera sp.]|nr:RNA polymerase factor sigma-54 [Nitrososphaera sp.]
MAIQLRQTLQQKLLLAPNITLALEVLRLPTLELRSFIEHQLEENPCLELEDNPAETSTSSSSASNESENLQPIDPEQDEWSSLWRSALGWEDQEEKTSSLENSMAIPQSLYDWLLTQLGCQVSSPKERKLGETAICHINEHGYLDCTLEELSKELGVDVQDAGATLAMIQRFDPPGVGARDLRECLMIQLEMQDLGQSLAYRILKDHLTLFAHHRFESIAKAVRTSQEEVDAALAVLKRLNPRPGCAIAVDLPPAIVPDLVIHHRDQHYDVELNDEHIPHLMINRTYYRMLRDPNTPADAKEFLSNKVRQANWLVKAISERNATLLSVARCLISLQREFLEHGLKALKPLTQTQVAGLIGRHASTVSRAIYGKTIDTPYGVFRLE